MGEGMNLSHEKYNLYLKMEEFFEYKIFMVWIKQGGKIRRREGKEKIVDRKGSCHQCWQVFEYLKSIFIFYQYMLKTDRSAPNLNADSLQVRYQKALKEISKLTDATTEVKKQFKIKQQLLLQMENQNKKLVNKLSQSILDRKQLETQLIDVTRKYQSLECANIDQMNRPQSTEKMHRNPSIDYMLASQLDRTSIPSESGKQLKKKIQQFSDKNYEQQNRIEQLIQTNHQKTVQIQNLSRQSQNLKLKIQELEKNAIQSHQYQYPKNSFLHQSNINQMSREELLRKVKISNHWVKDVNDECSQLKSKVFQLQRNQKVMSIKTERNSSRMNSPIPSVRSSMNPGAQLFNDYMLESQGQPKFTQILRKVKKLEGENKTLLKKHEHSKEQLEMMGQNMNFQRREIEKLRKQNQGYQKIIQKQEKEMKHMISTYEEEINKMTNDFKLKIEEQRRMFGPGNVDKIKVIQNLQNERNSWKKQFYKCSQELKKNYEQLQSEKKNVYEYKISYKNLAEENVRLKELVKKFEGSGKKKEEVKNEIMVCSFAGSEKLPSSLQNYIKQSENLSTNLNKDKIF